MKTAFINGVILDKTEYMTSQTGNVSIVVIEGRVFEYPVVKKVPEVESVLDGIV